jgi:hypothetical protein
MLILYSTLARAAILFGTSAQLSVTSLLGSLGAAGAAVAVTFRFLTFLKGQKDAQAQILAKFRGHHAESQRKFQHQLDLLSNRQLESQHDFQDTIERMTKSQDIILRDAIVTMKGMEDTIGSSTATIHGINQSIGSLGLTVCAIDTMYRDPAGQGIVVRGRDKGRGTRGSRGDTTEPITGNRQLTTHQ